MRDDKNDSASYSGYAESNGPPNESIAEPVASLFGVDGAQSEKDKDEPSHDGDDGIEKDGEGRTMQRIMFLPMKPSTTISILQPSTWLHRCFLCAHTVNIDDCPLCEMKKTQQQNNTAVTAKTGKKVK